MAIMFHCIIEPSYNEYASYFGLNTKQRLSLLIYFKYTIYLEILCYTVIHKWTFYEIYYFTRNPQSEAR